MYGWFVLTVDLFKILTKPTILVRRDIEGSDGLENGMDRQELMDERKTSDSPAWDLIDSRVGDVSLTESSLGSRWCMIDPLEPVY